MNKLITFLLTLNLGVHHPTLTFLVVSSLYFYNLLSEQEKEQLQSLMSNIISNGKLFTQYLSKKAKELNITLPDLRQYLANDLEQQTTILTADQLFTEEELENMRLEVEEKVKKELEHYQTELEQSPFYQMLDEGQQERLKDDVYLQEKLRKVIIDSMTEVEETWKTASLSELIDHEGEEEEALNFSIKKDLEEVGITDVDVNKIFTQKDFRQLKKRLKAMGRSSDSNVIDSALNRKSMRLLARIESIFTDIDFFELLSKYNVNSIFN